MVKMEIDYINGSRTDKKFWISISKYQMEIVKRLNVELNVIEYDSLMPLRSDSYENKSLKFITDMGKNPLKTIDKHRYIHTVKNEVKEGNIKHITSQGFAYVLNSVKLENNIVTCYDIIPWVYDKDRSPIWKENMKGLGLADIIITISKFSKDEIMKYLDYPEERIRIVYPAVDHSLYYENRDKKILSKIKISNDQKVVLYVGSETSRQNVPVLIKAFAQLKKKIPGIKMVKIGESQGYRGRENILKLINDLHLQEDIIFVGYIPEEDMPKWYNAADILVYPSAYAGFGLPPLEAMACGTPVITSNTTSLPEVVGDAGIMIDPQNIELMADKMYDVLTNDTLKDNMINKGLKRAKLFRWDDAAEKTLNIYREFL